MRAFKILPFVMIVLLATFSVAQEHAHHVPASANLPANSFTSQWDFFTNYGNYLPRTHCLLTAEGKPDWTWIGILTVLNVVVIAGYTKIFLFWRQCYLAENVRDRNTKLMDLAGIFLLCATCGYGMSIVTLFWPAYRLLAILMVGLSFFTWRFARDLDEFRLTFSAKRLQRELQEHLHRRNQELETLVNERTLELEKANQFKRVFLANMSHEIRTPMTAILGFTDLLSDPTITHAEREQYLGTLRRNGQHLLGLLNDVLDLSRIEAGKLTIEKSHCDLFQIMSDVLANFEQRAREKGLTLTFACDTPVPRHVEIDDLRTRQILSNLLGNSLKFTQAGSITVRLSYTAAGGLLSIAVHDTGCGIAPEHLAGVFDAFNQGDRLTTRRFGGSGLGLTISRNLARLMGGDLTVVSTVGVGSVFTLTLPPGDVTSEPLVKNLGTSAPNEVSPELPVAGVLAGLRVLIAEDSVDTQTLLNYLLTRSGASVEMTDNGDDVVTKALNGTAYDLILMDMQMPQTDGLTATRRLRENGYSGPIIALTANAMVTDRDRCISAGCTDYASKPISPNLLIETILRTVRACETAR
jgi:signal transduction histidine kinase